MSDAPPSPAPGTIGWTDLTVEDAESVKDFYASVVGWSPTPVSMGDYDDFNMMLRDGETCVAGICHARGSNEGLPPVWMIYVTVEDIDASARACLEHGGKVLRPPTEPGGMGRFCVIRDPAGAVCALFEPKAE